MEVLKSAGLTIAFILSALLIVVVFGLIAALFDWTGHPGVCFALTIFGGVVYVVHSIRTYPKHA